MSWWAPENQTIGSRTWAYDNAPFKNPSARRGYGTGSGRNSVSRPEKPWPIAQVPCVASRTIRAECRLVLRSRPRSPRDRSRSGQDVNAIDPG